MKKSFFAALCGLALAAPAADAGIQFTYGPAFALETADSFGVLLYASTDVLSESFSVTGVDLIQIINDGGATLGNPATPPVFTFVTLKPTGGLFADFDESENLIFGDPQAFEIRLASIGTPPDTVTIDNTPRPLAGIAFDTTGLIGNTFTLSNFISGGDELLAISSFSVAGTGQDVNVNPTTALITIPEPATLGLAGVAAMGLLARRRKTATV